MKKIIVADDDLQILEVVRIILEENGYSVETVSNPTEIFKKVTEVMPDALIIDVLLAGKDGRDLTWQIKSYDKTKNIPIIIVSAHPMAEETARESGANAFIPKPFDIDTLIEKVEELTS